MAVIILDTFTAQLHRRIPGGRQQTHLCATHPSVTAASTAIVVAIYIHAVAWFISYFSILYLMSANVFPHPDLLAPCFLMALHLFWFFECSRTMPNLLAATDYYGASVLLASMCYYSLV
jgi:hypothetical protein